MAEKDIASKKLEDYGDVFADIYNTLLFQQPLIDPKLLKDGPLESIYKLDSDKDMEQRRDTLKEYQDSMRFVIAAFCIENQAAIDKTMPVRVMSYDAGSYKQQVKEPQMRSIEDDTRIKHIEAFLSMLSAFTKDERYTRVAPDLIKCQKEGGVVNMCTIAEGLINEGRIEGEYLMATLIARLFADGRTEDAKKAAVDEESRRRLYREYGLID